MGIFKFFRSNKDKMLNEGVDAMNSFHFLAAIQNFTRVIELDPNNEEAHWNLALCYTSVNNYLASVRHYKEYMRLNPQCSDEDFGEYINLLEKAASLNSAQAEQLLNEYFQKDDENSKKAIIDTKTILFDQLLETTDHLLFSKGFLEGKTVQKFGDAMSAKIPIRFYGIKGFQNMDPKDAFGFALAFASSGYAVAKASMQLLGKSLYLATLSEDIIQRFHIVPTTEGIPISYDVSLMKNGNPIHWKLVKRVLNSCIESNLPKLFARYPWTRIIVKTINDRIVKEFVFIGYYVGLWENITER